MSWSWSGQRAAFSGAVNVDRSVVDRSVGVPVRLRRTVVLALTAIVSLWIYVVYGLVLCTGRKPFFALSALSGLLMIGLCISSVAQDNVGFAVTAGVVGLANLWLGYVLERNNLRRWRTARRAR